MLPHIWWSKKVGESVKSFKVWTFFYQKFKIMQSNGRNVRPSNEILSGVLLERKEKYGMRTEPVTDWEVRAKNRVVGRQQCPE